MTTGKPGGRKPPRPRTGTAAKKRVRVGKAVVAASEGTPTGAASAAGPAAPAPAMDAARAPTLAQPGGTIDPEKRRALIAERAYRLAAERRFAPGGEIDDWLAAERAVDHALRSGNEGGQDPPGGG